MTFSILKRNLTQMIQNLMEDCLQILIKGKIVRSISFICTDSDCAQMLKSKLTVKLINKAHELILTFPVNYKS